MSAASGRAAFGFRDYQMYLWARLSSITGQQMQNVAVGWQVYALTGSALDLGLIGLAQFLPFIVCTIPAGRVADRYDRRSVMVICFLLQAVCAVLLAAMAIFGVPGLWPIYAVMAALGVGRAFASPATSALLPHLVPTEVFPNAVAWTSSMRQVSVLVGPAAGGFLYAWRNSAGDVYIAAAVLSVAAAAFVIAIAARTGRAESKGISLQTVMAGFRFVVERKLLLGCMSLDLFAVLLGGAVALLPIFAKDILHTGPWGLGLLRSAPAIGAGLTAVWVAHHPLEHKPGAKMLVCVALFGVATIGFGLSREFWLSLSMLVVTGATDMISVVIRMTLEQIATPPHMRGRVSAVNTMFIGASNELGEFRSGVTAAWWGTIPAVVVGGVGTLVVVTLWTLLFPELRRVKRLTTAE